MLSNLVVRAVARNSILSACRRYKDSQVQARMHETNPNQAKVNAIKSTLNLEGLANESEGCIMIREFLFQESIPEVEINFRSKYLTPTGKWTYEQMAKLAEIDTSSQQTSTETENDLMLEQMEERLKERLDQYYKNLGRQNYTFSLKEEVMKISQMSPEKFNNFMTVLQRTKMP